MVSGLLGLQPQYPEDWMAVGLRSEGFIGCSPLGNKEAPGDGFLIDVEFEHWGASCLVVFLLYNYLFRMASPTQRDPTGYSGVFDPISGPVGCHQPSLLVDPHKGHRGGMEPPAATALNRENVVLPGW